MHGQVVPTPLPVGTRARIQAPTLPEGGLTGRLLGQREDTVFFRPEHRPYTFPLITREIRRVDLVVAHRRNTKVGFAVGTLLGMGLGTAVALGTSDMEQLPRGAAIGGGIGLVVGTLVGGLTRTEVWGRYEAPLQVAAP